MKDLQAFLESGTLEIYAMDVATAEESAEVEEMMLLFPEVVEELNAVRKALEDTAEAGAIEPDPIIRPFLMATIDYSDRMMSGEPFSMVPVLNSSSKIADFEQWLQRPDMVAPDGFEGVFAKILTYTATLTAAIVWLREMAPQEVHHDQYERFLIWEGTCEITIEDDRTYSLAQGDYLQIPLHKSHYIVVTSMVPCKVLLERVAA